VVDWWVCPTHCPIIRASHKPFMLSLVASSLGPSLSTCSTSHNSPIPVALHARQLQHNATQWIACSSTPDGPCFCVIGRCRRCICSAECAMPWEAWVVQPMCLWEMGEEGGCACGVHAWDLVDNIYCQLLQSSSMIVMDPCMQPFGIQKWHHNRQGTLWHLALWS
jgi:hypothetical protein